MDDFDIYGDLHDIEKEAQQERQEVQELQRKIADLQAQVLAKEQEKQAIVAKNVILSENISSLLLTAKAELKRKDTIIADLRKQCDDTVFRRKHVHYKEVHRVSKCTQTSYVRQVHIGVQVEQAEDESAGRTKKSDCGKIHDRDREHDRQKDRDREKSSYRERDRVRERDRDCDKSQGLDRDHGRFRERDRHKDWHRDREKVQPRQRERDQTGDRYRARDSSRHRNNNERSEDRIRESNKDLERKIARERQKGYQHDMDTSCEPRVVRSKTKSTERKDKPLRNDRKSIHHEESLHSKDRKTKMQAREKSVAVVADRKVRPHTPVSQFTNSHCDAKINRNEEIPLINFIAKFHEEKVAKDQPLFSGGEYSEPIERENETDGTAYLVNEPVGQTVGLHSETDPSISSRLINDCGIAEKNAVDFGQKKGGTGFDASVLDKPISSSIPAVMETVSDNEKDLQCHRDQQKDVCVTQKTEIMCFENTVDHINRADCAKFIDSPQRLTYKTDESSLVSKSNQKKSRGEYEIEEDATIFEEMLDVCGEPHTLEDHEQREENIDSKAIDNQVTSSSFLENVLEGVEDARNKSNGNINFVSDNNDVVEAVKQSECIPKEHRDSCITTIVDGPLDDKQITNDSLDHVQTVGGLESFGQRPETSKSKGKAYWKIAKTSKSSGDDIGATNVGDTAGKTSAKIAVDVDYLQDKSYNVEDNSVCKDHLMGLEDKADEQASSHVEKDRVDNTIEDASTNDGSNLFVDGGGLKNELKPGALDVHLKSKVKSNAHQHPIAEYEGLPRETLRATEETPVSVPKPSTESTPDSLLVSESGPTQQAAQTAPIRLKENPVECRIEHVDEINDSACNIKHQKGMRTRSKSVCLEKVPFCHQDCNEACDIVVCSPSKAKKVPVMSKTEENLRNRKSSDVVSDHATPSKQDTRSSSTNLKQRDKFVPPGNPDGSGSIRDRLRKMFCTDRPQKSSRSSATNKRRLSLDSAPTAMKKQKAENDCIDNSISSSSSTSKLSDTFFSSIFLPIVSSLDSIHLKTESPTPNRFCPMPSRSNMPSMVVVHSPIKFERSPLQSPRGQATTQALMDSLVLSWVKDEDAVELEEGQRCIANDRSRKDHELDHIRFSPQHLLASSTPLIAKPQSRMHHSTSSVPAMPSEGGACTGVKVALNSKSWTAPLDNPMPSGASSVTADKLSKRETANCKDKHNRKPNEQKRTEVVVEDASKSKRPASTTKSVHRQSGDEGRFRMVNGTHDRILVSDSVSNHSDKDRFTFSPASIDKKSKKRRDSAISNIEEKVIIFRNSENDSCKKHLPPGVFKTPDVVKSGNRLQHTPTNTLLFASFSSHESNEFPMSQKQNQSPVTAKVREDGTPLTSRKRSRTSTSPKRRKIDVTEGEGIFSGKSHAELSPEANNKKKRMNTAVDEINEESLPTNISMRPRDALLENSTNAEVDVPVGKNKTMNGVRNLPTKGKATVDTIVDKTVTSASPLEVTSNVSPALLASVESFCHTRSPNSLQQEPIERTQATVKTPEFLPQSESLSGQGPDTTTSLKSPMSGSATHKMCNFSLNLSLASTGTIEQDTSVMQKSETPVRFVREMRIVKENPKLLRVYINRRGD